MDSKNPAEYFRTLLFNQPEVKKNAEGQYLVIGPWRVAGPLEWLTFKGSRKPGLLIKTVEWTKNPGGTFFKVATPPFKKTKNFKTEEELISFVPVEDLAPVVSAIASSSALGSE